MAPDTRLSVVIAHGDNAGLAALRAELHRQGDFEIAAMANDFAGAMTAVGRTNPHILLMHQAVAEDDFAGAVERVARTGLRTRLFFLADKAPDCTTVARAAGAGAMGLIARKDAPAGLAAALRRVASGAPAFPATGKQASPAPGPHDALTARERDILQEIARGLSNREIAEAFKLSEGTIKGYVSTVLSKLAVKDRTEAALYAIGRGLAEGGARPDSDTD